MGNNYKNNSPAASVSSPASIDSTSPEPSNTALSITSSSVPRKVKKKKSSKTIKPYFRYSTLITGTLMLISIFLLNTFYIKMAMSYDSIHFDLEKEIFESKLWAMANTAALSARIALLILLNGRLYYTFEDTVYMVKKWKFYALNSLALFIPVLIIISLLSKHFINALFFVILLVILINIALLLYLFNRRLMTVTVTSILSEIELKKQPSESVNDKKEEKRMRKKIKLHKHEKDLLELVTRNSLLILSILIIGSIPSLLGLYAGFNDVVHLYEISIMIIVGAMMQSFIIICVSLLYPFSDKYYNIFCKCSNSNIRCCYQYWGHSGCLNLCTRIAKNKIIKTSDIDNSVIV